MKYKTPTAGELFNADINEVSLVDTPANGRKFLIKKGIDKMDTKEELKKAGLDPDQVVKSLDSATPEQKESIGTGFINVFKSVFGLDKKTDANDSTEELKKSIATLTNEVETLKKNNAVIQENNLSETEKLKKELEETNKALEQETSKDSEIESLKKELADKKEMLESVKKARIGGNAEFNNGQTSLTPEEIKKQAHEVKWQSHGAFKF